MEEENCFSSDDSDGPISDDSDGPTSDDSDGPTSDDSDGPISLKRMESLDRISNLPEVLMIRILSLLPSTKNAVRTSILSKKWRYLWTSITVLDFKDIRDILDHTTSLDDMNRFLLCVNHTLLLNQSINIDKFRLSMVFYNPFNSYVDVWLRLLTRKHVERLDLSFEDYYSPREYSDGSDDEPAVRYKLPINMFSNNTSLVTLKLKNCDIYYDKHFNWNSLVVLNLRKVSLSDGLIEKMLSGCRRLEVLEMHNCWNYKSLDIKSETLSKLVISERDSSSDVLHVRLPTRINAPHLQSLAISGGLYDYMIVTLPSLVDTKLNFCNGGFHSVPMTSEHIKILGDLFESLRHAKDLTVGSMCLQVLSKLDEESMSYPFSNVVCLTVGTTLDQEELHGLTRLLRYNPLMETLIINMTYMSWKGTWSSQRYDHDEDNDYWSSPKNSFASALLNLKTIRIIGFGVTEGETELLLFLLKNSRMLKKMTIHARNMASVGLKNTLDVAQRLLNCPRCSKNAVVVFD